MLRIDKTDGLTADSEPRRSSGSHRNFVSRSVHSADSRGLDGNLSVVFQFRLKLIS